MTTNVTCPGASRFMPWARERMRHLGGKMLDTRTRLHAAMPADRNASSNEVSFSRCFPTPLVKNISFGTKPTTLTLLARPRRVQTQRLARARRRAQRAASRTNARENAAAFVLHGKHQLSDCQGNRRAFGWRTLI